MKAKDSVPLKNVIRSVLGNLKSPKYLHGLDFAYVDSTDIYQGALSNLLNGESEKTLKCIIFGLDIDRENNSIIHLARTMLFSLSEDFYESDGHIFKQKYGDFEKSSEQLKKKVANLKKEVESLRQKLEAAEFLIEQTKKSFVSYFMKKGKLNKDLTEIRLTYTSQRDELSKQEEALEKIKYLEKIEEYIKVLGTVLEVCIFPSRFAWAISS